MLHLQKLLLPICRPACPSLYRALLLSTAAVGASPVRFAAEDYLVTTCGLTREQAVEAAKYIAHRKSPANANAVLSFLASPALGLSRADIAHLISQDARILNCSVDKTIRPRIDAFFSHGFTAAQIRSLLCRTPSVFRSTSIENLGFWLSILGSPEKCILAARRSSFIFSTDLDRVVKVNIQLLRDSGLSDASVAKLCLNKPRLITGKTDNTRAILNRADELGVPCNSLRFRDAVMCAAGMGPETIAAKLKFMSQMLGFSHAEVAKAVKTTPKLLSYSTEKLRRVSEYLTKVVGVDSKYIMRCPTILCYSIERRIAPRHYVMKVLLEKGLMRKEQSFYSLLLPTDKTFRSKYIIPHEDVLPGLADAYASACKGKLPPT